MQHESVATKSPLCDGYIESLLVRTGMQFSGTMIWYKQFRSFCYSLRVEPSSLSLTGTKCKLLTTRNDSGSLLRRVCCYNRANRIYINHLQIAVHYTTPTDSLWEPPNQSPLKMTWQCKTRSINYICHSLQFVTVVLKVPDNLLWLYLRNEYLEQSQNKPYSYLTIKSLVLYELTTGPNEFAYAVKMLIPQKASTDATVIIVIGVLHWVYTLNKCGLLINIF